MEVKNNMICDLETGVCGPGSDSDEIMEFIDLSIPVKKVDLYYVTDPICSHCWALEPVLRKFVGQYGHYFNVHILMGGLLESWNGFADVANGINDPSNVAGHWREVGEQSRMPIDGTVWYDNPISSSYIPSRVFKVIHDQSPEAASIFLRRAKEALFAFNLNIAEEQVLIELVNQVGLNGEHIVKQSNLPEAHASLQEDFQQVGKLGVRGFPTIILLNEEQKGVKVVGARPIEQYVAALQQVLPTEKLNAVQLPNLDTLLKKEKLLFVREIEEFYSVGQHEVIEFITAQLPQVDYELNEIVGEKYIKSSV